MMWQLKVVMRQKFEECIQIACSSLPPICQKYAVGLPLNCARVDLKQVDLRNILDDFQHCCEQ